MTNKLLNDPIFKAQVKKLASEFQAISDGWSKEGIKIGYPISDKRHKLVNELIAKYPKPVIANAVTYLLIANSLKSMAALGGASLAIDEMKNRAKNLGSTPKKTKQLKAERLLILWGELSAKGLDKTPAAEIIAEKLTEEGFPSKPGSIRRSLTQAKLNELTLMYKK